MDNSALKNIGRFVTEQLAIWEVPGCAVAVVRDGGIVLTAGWGHRDVEQDLPVTADTLDFTEPIALILVAVLHFLPDEDNPRRIVQTLTSALPSGSYLVASHATAEHNPGGLSGAGRAYSQGGMRGAIRNSEVFADLAFAGLDLVDPGVVLVSEWRPDRDDIRPLAAEVNTYGGVARKP